MTDRQQNNIPTPEPTLYRLPWYLAFVNTLRQQGVEYISSTAISKAINVDASQIVKDLSVLGIKGKTRIGYDVVTLQSALKEFLGFTRRHNAVIFGVGSLGAALIADEGLSRFGLNIVAGFDIDPALVGSSIRDIPVFHPDRLPELIDSLNAEIGIISVPVEVAQQVADYMTANGVKALWNFTPWRINPAPGIVIQNTSIYAHLAVMYNRLNEGQ